MSRIIPAGGPVPDVRNHDFRAVKLNDGRHVIISGLDAYQNNATTPEKLLELARTLAYDEERKGRRT